MDQQRYQVELIERARRGDKASLDELAAQARERLRTYVYRMTQDDSLTQDIVQETLFEMCKALGKLKNTERFWPWLHGIATNKLRRFYRTEKTQRNLAAASAKRKGEMADRVDGLENLVSEELKGIVSAAMNGGDEETQSAAQSRPGHALLRWDDAFGNRRVAGL